ncbi:MAG: enolase C-terminal domain-like protein [Candidatus Microbacterium phytovorans]|uniref:Enolase C-terminal domain-like protein n=1 Tax=Candidatus Microbacterium phytovorans TaxID=3121374 RepID=A0AAJ6B2L2_9MICO|nr:enolase C-terminal domain-like protein [Microbacterium sp.]WEK13010.1 MAG: enolase C-terminal domain-like protein [Microbacterium sp.]
MIEVTGVTARVVPVQTRLPFRYGIAEMTAAPHVVVEVALRRADGTASRGWASEHLPPKWFTKNPDSSFADDLIGLVGVVEHAVEAATGLRAASAFALWRALDQAQMRWAEHTGIPGLLAGLGTALVERAVIDAVCRAARTPFVTALHSGALGFDPGSLHPELAGIDWRAHLRTEPAPTIAVRHTVGFADALTADEVVDRPDDDLPVSLDEVIRRDGVHHLKIKTAGDAAADLTRLGRIFAVCDALGVEPRLTVDANESMRDGDHLDRWARALLSHAQIGPRLRDALIAVEQPVHRDAAFAPELGGVLRELSAQGMPVIIDESDDGVDAVRRALDLGYAGGTYKGCKGVFRGLANGVLAGHRATPDRPTIMTAEDLSTLPPLTVAQDLVVAATLGLTHIERNGHHYFGRLAPLMPDIGALARDSHPDLYRADSRVDARLRVSAGVVEFGSALAAPFGFAPELDVSALPLLTLQTARAAV